MRSRLLRFQVSFNLHNKPLHNAEILDFPAGWSGTIARGQKKKKKCTGTRNEKKKKSMIQMGQIFVTFAFLVLSVHILYLRNKPGLFHLAALYRHGIPGRQLTSYPDLASEQKLTSCRFIFFDYKCGTFSVISNMDTYCDGF